MMESRKYKGLISIIVFLLITNIVLLVLFMINKNAPEKKTTSHEQKGLYTLLQKEVGFSQPQLEQYQALRTEQRKNIKPMFDKVRRSKQNFYELLYTENVPDSILNNDADSIAQTQKQLDLQMYSHFKKIRKICTNEQVEKFDSSIKKVIARMISRPGKSKPDGK